MSTEYLGRVIPELLTDKEAPTALYRHYSSNGELIYVGISKNPYRRTGEHKALSEWFDKVSTIKIEWLPTREEALKAEKAAIKNENPKFNIVHNASDAIAEEIEEDLCKIMVKERDGYSSRNTLQKLANIAGLNTINQASEIIGLSARKIEELVLRDVIGAINIGERKTSAGRIKILYMIPYFEIMNFLDLVATADIRELASRPIVKQKYMEEHNERD